MDLAQLQTATLQCLEAQSSRYGGAAIEGCTPITGGYSRLTFRIDLALQDGHESVVLQYAPPGATGLVRVDRKIERDLLQHLGDIGEINAPRLIASDLESEFFDSAAYVYEAARGQPYTEMCRNTDESEHGAISRTVAQVAAQVQNADISKLPASMEQWENWDHYLDHHIETFAEVERRSKMSRPFLRYLRRWLDENRPPEAPLSLVHGDFQISNMIVDEHDSSAAVLVDWELARVGDPREDLGWYTMVCGTIPPNLMATHAGEFYDAYRRATGLSEHIVNPATSAYFLIISSIRTHYGMLRSSDALAESHEQSQSVLAAYYMNITTYQHLNWMNAIQLVEQYNGTRS